MKTFKKITLISFITLIFATLIFPLQSCKKNNDDNDQADTVKNYKPNIYIYTQKKIQLDVEINFPQGGKIVASIPKYNNGWHISVDTNGFIDNKYTYLFYESKQPNVWQKKYGWIIPKNELKSFFEKNMKKYGFNDSEIKDFTSFWCPKLKGFKFFKIYPQTDVLINKVVKLKFSKHPDKALRLYYVIKGSDNNNDSDKLIKPFIKKFDRKGFYITEWGVIL